MKNSQEKRFNTYKSIWTQDLSTGDYKRDQKHKYPLETLVNLFSPIVKHIPKVRGIIPLLSKKPQGVDFYKYYTDIILSGDRGKWAGQLEAIVKRLSDAKLPSLERKNILDISGEPGYFASDLKPLANRVVVTGFAEEVAKAMRDHLGVEASKYDFQNDLLSEVTTVEKFDFIFVRYAIGFCENLDSFFKDCLSVLNTQGFLWISFSPASRAVCARWMFDDYTYLRQYTKESLLNTADANGFKHVTEWDDGSFEWDARMHPVQKLISLPYTFRLFRNVDKNERRQHNVAVLLQKTV